MSKEWFVDWFNSGYYHLLYKNHDDDDAQQALDNLLRALNLAPGARILDLACGKGRHARYLAEKGFDVTGVDISESNISFARQHEHAGLAFYRHDMRLPFRINYFDAVMNMFTSFGYFKDDRDHLLTLKNIAKDLKPGGLLLLDFFNSEWVRRHLVRSETKIIDGIEFHLKRNIRNGCVYKHVEFEAGGRLLRFRERVRLFKLSDFQSLLNKSGLELIRTYGSYDLREFALRDSKRLILIARKRPHT